MSVRRPQKGEKISEYVLTDKVGEGGFGEVWKAHHQEITGKVVAIKIPTDEDYIRELRAEAVVQHDLDHPNVAKTLGLSTFHDPPYFIMEYVEGKSLSEILRERGKLPPEAAIEVMKCVLDALAYAHARGVLHLDVKPGNILCRIFASEESGEAASGGDASPRAPGLETPSSEAKIRDVKLTDFGLARTQRELANSFRFSLRDLPEAKSRSVSGTLLYMAPEQAAGGEVDRRTDLFAAGLVLYEMLTGSIGKLRFPIRSVDERLSDVVEMATEEDPDMRPESAEDFKKTLLEAWADLQSDVSGGKAGSGDEGMSRIISGADESIAVVRAASDGDLRGESALGTTWPALYCPSCYKVVEPRDFFCIHCGRQMRADLLKCPVCGNLPEEDDLYCVFCGHTRGVGRISSEQP